MELAGHFRMDVYWKCGWFNFLSVWVKLVNLFLQDHGPVLLSRLSECDQESWWWWWWWWTEEKNESESKRKKKKKKKDERRNMDAILKRKRKPWIENAFSKCSLLFPSFYQLHLPKVIMVSSNDKILLIINLGLIR